MTARGRGATKVPRGWRTQSGDLVATGPWTSLTWSEGSGATDREVGLDGRR